ESRTADGLSAARRAPGIRRASTVTSGGRYAAESPIQARAARPDLGEARGEVPESGRSGLPAKEVKGNLPWVRIPPSPLHRRVRHGGPFGRFGIARADCSCGANLRDVRFGVTHVTLPNGGAMLHLCCGSRNTGCTSAT